MKKPFFLLFTFAIFNIVSAQNTLIKKWDYRYGGTGGDYLSRIINTSDGGFLLDGKLWVKLFIMKTGEQRDNIIRNGGCSIPAVWKLYSLAES
jgi:hypothetical protein